MPSLTDPFNAASERQEKNPDLSGRLPVGVDFSQINIKLQNADLSGANLQGADLRPMEERVRERTNARRLWAIKNHGHKK